MRQPLDCKGRHYDQAYQNPYFEGLGVEYKTEVDDNIIAGTTLQSKYARETALRTLSLHKEELSSKYGLARLGIFGSVARDQATDASDVDIVVEMPPNLFQMVHMKEELAQRLGVPVDLIRLHKHLNALLKSRIDDEAIYV
jgi:predicted nucleotidyltransferase